jgi:hypothetical protein
VDTGGLSKKDRIRHRIELKFASEIDQEVGKWLKTACDLDAYQPQLARQAPPKFQ